MMLSFQVHREPRGTRFSITLSQVMGHADTCPAATHCPTGAEHLQEKALRCVGKELISLQDM